jgi:DNA-binding HxlR family transcriptional regulator
MSGSDIDEVDPFHQFVLLSVIDLRARDDVPVHSFDVTGVCEDLLDQFDELDEMVPGGVTRQRVINALSELESAELLGEERKESPTGKGRPAYSLDIAEEEILEALAADDQFTDAVERIRARRE